MHTMEVNGLQCCLIYSVLQNIFWTEKIKSYWYGTTSGWENNRIWNFVLLLSKKMWYCSTFFCSTLTFTSIQKFGVSKNVFLKDALYFWSNKSRFNEHKRPTIDLAKTIDLHWRSDTRSWRSLVLGFFWHGTVSTLINTIAQCLFNSQSETQKWKICHKIFTYPHVVPNLTLFCSLEHKRRFHAMKVNGVQSSFWTPLTFIV